MATFTIDAAEQVPVEITLRTRDDEPELQVAWHTAENTRPRPLRRMFLPWTPSERSGEANLAEAEVPELKGGNWGRGRQVFTGEQAGCAK